MKALKCDDCGDLYEKGHGGTYYLIRDGVSSFVTLEINLDLCNKCWNKMIEKIQKELFMAND